MNGASKILTVSYGTFSCTLEGFDDPFNTMKAIAEYFRDLAAEDRYFGAEPPTPDAAMLHRIAEREIQRRVEAKIGENGLVLRADEGVAPKVTFASAPVSAQPPAPPVAAAAPVAAPPAAPLPAAPVLASAAEAAPAIESAAVRLSRLRAAQAQSARPQPAPVSAPAVEAVVVAPVAPAAALQDYAEDQEPAPAADEARADEARAAKALADQERAALKEQRRARKASLLAAKEAASVAVEPAAAEAVAPEPAPQVTVAAAPQTAAPAVAEALALDSLTASIRETLAGFGSGDDQLAVDLSDAQTKPAAELAAADDFDAGFDDILPEDSPAEDRALIEDYDQIGAAALSNSFPEAEFAATEAETVEAAAPDAAQSEVAQFEVGQSEVVASEAADAEAVEPPAEAIVTAAAMAEIEAEIAAAQLDADLDAEIDAEIAAAVEAETPAQTVPAEVLAEAPAETRAEAEVVLPSIVVAERIQRARARVIKIRRLDTVPTAPAPADNAARPVADAADAAPHAAPLSPEAEADLASELAALQAELAPTEAAPAEAPATAAEATELQAAEDLTSEVLTAEDQTVEDQVAEDQVAEPKMAEPVAAELPAEEVLAAEAPQDAPHAEPQAEPHRLPAVETGEAAVNRLLEKANTEFEVPETKRRRSAIAHLKAAVLATVAERRINPNATKPDAERMDPYRQDLNQVVRPSSGERPAPLVLVSSQRIDRTPESAIRPQAVQPVRPRRVTSGMHGASAANRATIEAVTLRMADADDRRPEDVTNVFADPGKQSFQEFADALGATSMQDLIEAAGAYCTLVLGQESFTRPLLFSQIESLPGHAPETVREDSLRGFGRLLRDGRLTKTKRGQYVMAESSPILTEARRQAQ